MSRRLGPTVAVVLPLIAATAIAGVALRAGGEASGRAPSPSAETSGAAPVAGSPLAHDPRAYVASEHDGTVLVGLVARPGGPVDLIPLTLTGPAPARSVHVTVREGGAVASPTPSRCGYGCLRLGARVLAGRPVTIAVRVDGALGRPARLTLDLPRRLPPSARALARRADRVMAAQASIVSRQVLSSGAGRPLVTTYAMRAPDRVAYRTGPGTRTILIGHTRWDLADGRWSRHSFPGVRVPDYPWTGAIQPRMAGTEIVAGRRLTLVSLFHPRYPAWFTLAIDRAGRVERVTMHARGHFMRQTYRFPPGVSIRPPRAGG
jgi:hypothetical protein